MTTTTKKIKFSKLEDSEIFKKIIKDEMLSKKKIIDLSKIPCKFNRKCTKVDCKFMHNLKTKMCKFGNKCFKINDCSFAHCISELYIPECKFGNQCKNEKCEFKHPIVIKKKEFVTKPKIEKNNLTIDNFPINLNVENIKSNEEIINYTEMKDIINFINHVIIESNDVQDMIEQLKCIRSFNHLTFKFI